MTEKVDTEVDRFCALGRTEPTKAANYYCYGIRWRAHGGDGVFCRNHKHLGGTPNRSTRHHDDGTERES